MKKLLACALALLLTLGSLAALAQEEFAEPILFRGIEWGTSLEALKGTGLFISDDQSPLDESLHGMAYFLYRGEDARDFSDYRMYEKPLYVKDVGGKSVSNANAWFVCVPNESGAIDTADYSTYSLVGGLYTLHDYSEALFDEFTQKLTALYGDVDETVELLTVYGYGEVKVTSNVWWGADGTRVALNNFEGKAIRIAYASGDYDALVDSATIGNFDGL